MDIAKQKKLQKVYLNADVYAVCIQHALSTEKEEMMGLLIGHVNEEYGIAHISASIILRRSDKQADRVEISAVQLMEATTYAEKLAQELRRPMRVVGWYHSHPHITVWPSRVDVATQFLYQSMDGYFVGLIFSVFPNDTRKSENYNVHKNEIQLTCFQSQPDGIERREIPIYIQKPELIETSLNMMGEMSKILCDEEDELAEVFEADEDVDVLIKYYNMAQKFKGILNITEKTAKPLFEAAQAKLKANDQKLKCLDLEEKLLLRELDVLKRKNMYCE